MTTLILLRHGRTDANTAGILAGDSPAALDEVGERQARSAGERLAGVRFGWVVSSPLPRCRQTLSLALPEVSPAIEPGLTECGYGEWTGRKLSELIQEPQWPAIQAHPSAVTFPGGESMAAMSARAIASVRRWNETVGPEGIWLACTHGDIIKAIVADALGMHLDAFQRIHVAPGSLTVIKYTPVRPFLMRLSDDGPLAVQPASTSSDAAVGGGAE
jgi:probable phosphomutase (TIGR03848 family)